MLDRVDVELTVSTVPGLTLPYRSLHDVFRGFPHLVSLNNPTWLASPWHFSPCTLRGNRTLSSLTSTDHPINTRTVCTAPGVVG